MHLLCDAATLLVSTRISHIGISVHLSHKRSSCFNELCTCFQQGTSNQQHDPCAIEIKHLGDADGVHASCRDGYAGLEMVTAPRGCLRQCAAGIGGVAE